MKQNTDNEGKMAGRPFGVGCFNFRLKRKVPYHLKAGDYADALEKALSRLSSLSDLEISYDESTKDAEFEFDEEIPPLQDGGVFPFLQFGKIGFTLYIPTRIQDEVALGRVNTYAEQFRISIREQYFGPVAYVECLDSTDDDCNPSGAVRLVREYLRREFEKQEDVEFEWLGPSPFHANFHVHEDLAKTGIEVVETPQLGFDRFDITVNQPLSSEEAMECIFDAFDHELDHFYHLVRERSIQMNDWEALESSWSALRQDVTEPVKFYQITRKFSVHKRARNLITDAYTFAAGNSIAKQNAAEHLNSVYRKALQSHFKARLQAQFSEAFPDYPVQSIIAWATHVHDSSFKLAEIITLLLSGLLGGLVGALVTALLTT